MKSKLVKTNDQVIREKIQKSLQAEMARKTGEYVFNFLCRGLEVTPYELCNFICNGYFYDSEKYDCLERFYYTWVHKGGEV